MIGKRARKIGQDWWPQAHGLCAKAPLRVVVAELHQMHPIRTCAGQRTRDPVQGTALRLGLPSRRRAPVSCVRCTTKFHLDVSCWPKYSNEHSATITQVRFKLLSACFQHLPSVHTNNQKHSDRHWQIYYTLRNKSGRFTAI